MNKTIKDMITGILLGDAHIGKTGLNRAFISFEQSKAKAEYLNHVHKLFREGSFEIEEPKTYERTDSRYSKLNESLYFRTKSLEELKPFADIFLDKEGKKVIPSNIAEHLSPRSLAFWIMDDGQQVKKGGVTLCTDSYSSEEIGFLRKALDRNFNLITSIHKKKGKDDTIYERIYINKSSLEDVKPLLKEHMHSSMLYKINEKPETIENSGEITNSPTNNIEQGDVTDFGSDIGDF